jgi:sigma-E factor negative regulatory protein RseB
MSVKPLISLSLLALLATPILSYADEPADLLAKMQTAVHSLTYRGTLVYARGNDLSTYQVSHSREGGEEKESVLELAKGGDSKAVDSFSLSKFQQPNSEKAYSLDLGGQEFVANTACQIVIARPKDQMRYLQRYCIDSKTGMLLKYSLVDRSHQTIEQLMFTSIEMSGAATPVQEAKNADSVKQEPKVVAKETEAKADSNSQEWSFNNLPEGFQQTKNLVEKSTKDGSTVRQIVLSDGMTSVSVFIAPPNSPATQEGVALSAGAMNIYTTDVDKYKVTLVGEVPVSTLEKIGKGLKHAQ